MECITKSVKPRLSQLFDLMQRKENNYNLSQGRNEGSLHKSEIDYISKSDSNPPHFALSAPNFEKK